MSRPARCICGHLLRSHTAWKPGNPEGGCYLCPCLGYHRRLAAVRLAGPPDLDLVRKTDYTGD